ncbi:hypothetical protein AL036_09015 [Salipiger aestuarii]|uniref:MarR family transcriptional regulator for hemolysin n=1 Tax=Salipiger aestuarii TaxID=568098 RepID=A0A327YAW2_9RHOB|nr:MarR family transcriptional regulator [Salipiger aestuarii]EIE50858.1 putative transcription regulator protein [Citreicella sp. 357]KAA8607915.1 hypothetical protein AL036_09015 [Salipiger aestuarii]KAA8611181.1 hypothetical protein AL037_10205 [Salipiger aestuarii]KAB2541933.1 hypothetical protein AL035_09655 [Salipiger aestuarii]RAK18143.1 MarR family transcriptional regulator for hemolysin [Salipiger aestuarii]
MQSVDRRFLDLTFRLLREMRKQFDAEAKSLDMTLSRARALLKIQEKEGLTQTELADALDIETPTVNRLLDKLEQSGFVERRQLDGDKRVRCIFLTDHARGKARNILTFCNDMSRQVFQGVDPDDTRAATGLVLKLLANLEGGDS